MIAQNLDELQRIHRQCKTIVKKRSVVSGAAALVPVPGTDIAVDIALLTHLIKTINKKFGLTEEQMSKYDTWTQMLLFDVIRKTGAKIVGKAITKELIIALIKKMGLRITIRQLTKYIPVIGQTASVAISVSAVLYIGNNHIRECHRIVKNTILAKQGKSTFKAFLSQMVSWFWT